jgi:hypothetical protein
MENGETFDVLSERESTVEFPATVWLANFVCRFATDLR